MANKGNAYLVLLSRASGIIDSFVDSREDMDPTGKWTKAERGAMERAESVGGIVLRIPVAYRYDN